jgi:hypothetical protein
VATPGQRLSIAARLLTVGGVFLVAAAAFHFFAASHITTILKRVLNARTYEFLEPIVAFTFLLNGVLLLPLSFSTFYSAAGIRRGERWAWGMGLANAVTVLVLPCLLVATMGLRYFSGAPLLVAGAASISGAGLLMLAPLVWVRRDLQRPNQK